MKPSAASGTDDLLARLAAELEESLAAVGGVLGLTLTLIDAHGRFAAGSGGKSLFTHNRRSHQKNPFCAAGFCPRCIHHCRHEVGARSAASGSWFVHQCWKGAAELVIPLRLDGEPVGHLFAGQWPAADVPVAECARDVAQALRPGPEPEQLRLWAAILVPLAAGLMARISGGLRQGDRSLDGRIGRFLERNYHRPVTLAELAAELGVSPSRASHLAGSCGEPFQQRLLRVRMEAAKLLLREGELRVNEVARAVGLRDPYYFSRMFHRVAGCSPSEFRRTAKLAT